MLQPKELGLLPASRDHADFLIKQAQTHLKAARMIADLDPPDSLPPHSSTIRFRHRRERRPRRRARPGGSC